LREIYWSAGFLEGEGSFMWVGGLRVAAGQVRREPLDRLRRALGGRVGGPYKNGVARPQYHWIVYGPEAAAVMFTMYPLMTRQRKQQIRRALSKWRRAPGRGWWRRKAA